MARATFGGTAADYVVTTGADGLLRLSSATLTMWTAATGGSQITDLRLGGSPVTSIPVGADGSVPTFQGPDGVTELWADAGHGRVRLTAPVTVVDSAVAALASNPGSALGGALSASIAQQTFPMWKPNTAYPAGFVVLSPDGSIVKAKTAFTSGASYSAANWTTADGLAAAVSSGVAASSTVTSAAAAAVDTAAATRFLSYSLVYGTGAAASTATTANGTPAYAAGKFGNGLGGAAQLATASGAVPAPTPAAPITVEFWAKLAAPPTAIKVMLSLGGGLYFAAEQTTGYASLTLSGAAPGKVTSSVNVCDGNWHHFAAQLRRNSAGNTTVYEGFWIDGVPVSGTPTINGYAWSTAVNIGGLVGQTAYNWPGQLDEVRISSIARYTGTFTPPTAQFDWDGATILLAHLEDATYYTVGSSYPPRPAAAPGGSVTYLGPVQPTTWLTNDRWVDTSA